MSPKADARRSSRKRPATTGCRIDHLFGQWLCQAEKLDSWKETAWMVVERGELRLTQEQTAKLQTAEAEKPYTVDSNGIAKITLSGPMTKYPTSFQSLFGGISTLRMRKVFAQLRQDQAVKGVMIDADSPGGTVEGAAEFAEAARQLAMAKPTAVHAEDTAASGMLWFASQIPDFTCGPVAQIGSLGTCATLYDTSEQTKASGKKPVVITTGQWKALGASGLPITEEQKQEIQRIANDTNKPFAEDVFKVRKLNAEQRAEVLTSRVFIGQDAVRVGLCNKVCSADVAYNDLLQKVNAGPVDRGPVPAGPPVTAPTQRSARMPLSSTQLEQARKLPGGADITEANADEKLFNIAQAMSTDLGHRDTQIASLKQQVPRAQDPGVISDRAGVFLEKVDVLGEKGLILPPQIEKLKAAAKVGDAFNTALFTPLPDGKMAYQPFLDALAMNKPNGLQDDISRGQPQPDDRPGEPKDPKPMTAERKTSLLKQAGIPQVQK